MAYAVRKGTAEGFRHEAADLWFKVALKAQTACARTVASFAVVRNKLIQWSAQGPLYAAWRSQRGRRTPSGCAAPCAALR